MVKRIIVLLYTLILMGCSTAPHMLQHIRYFPPDEEKRNATSSDEVQPKVEMRTYGKFTVKCGDFMTVYKGVFYDIPPIPLPAKGEYVFFVNYTTKELTAYRRIAVGTYEPIVGYAVMTPFPESLPKDVVRGWVTGAVEKPRWCPKRGGTVLKEDLEGDGKITQSLGKDGCIPFGHPMNWMGVLRLDIQWEVPGWELNKIHGVEGFSNCDFWSEKTHGCIRVFNKDILDLQNKLGPDAFKGKGKIEVVVFR